MHFFLEFCVIRNENRAIQMIKINHRHSVFLLLFASSFFFCGCINSYDNYTRFAGEAQGGTYNITCRLPDTSDIKAVEASIDSLLKAVDMSISGYNKGSILSRVNDNQDIPLDDIFVETFTISKRIYDISGGAFDPSAAPLFDIWGFGFSQDTTATKMKVDSVLSFVGMEKVSLAKYDDGTIHLKKEDSRIKLNFNAIAQGFTCDLLAGILKREGCKDYIIELGGEIVCAGESPRKGTWRVWIDKPVDGNNASGELKQDILNITDCGLVTSGNYRKFYVKDGEKYSHTIDPFTGYPVTHTLLSATVSAQDGATADAYATWLMVVGLDAAKEIAQKMGFEAYLVYGEQDDMKVWHTPNLKLDSEN